jgi:hypothetical protein
MSEYIKTGIIPGQNLLREVAPVSPYPRINPHQPKREEYPRQPAAPEQGAEDKTRRRFTLMRELIEKLKESYRISRVDYATAEREMHDQGLAIAEEQLISQLLQLKVPLGGIDGLFQQIRQQSAAVLLAPGRKLTADSFPLFPESGEGLSEYCLVFANLKIRPDRRESRIVEETLSQGRFTSEAERLRLIFRRLPPGVEDQQDDNLLQLDIQLLVGAMEVDEDGRRAILYPRAPASFGLYADKQINLSI